MDLNLLFFISYAFALLGQFSDTRTTEVALSKGFTEANPIGKFLIAHLGISGTYALKVGALPIAFAPLALLIGFKYASVCEFVVGVLGFTLGVINFIKLKKAGVTFGQVFGV